MSRAGLAVLLVVAGCGESRETTERDSPGRTEHDVVATGDAEAVRGRCLADSDQVATLWTRLEHALALDHVDTVEGVLSIAEGEVRGIHDEDRAFEGQSYRIDARRAAVSASYQCGGHSEGGVLLLIAERTEGTWGVVDRVVFPAGAQPDVVAARGESFAVSAARFRTQDTVSGLWLLRAEAEAWRIVFERGDLIDLETDASDLTVAARWRERSTVFSTSVGGPMPSFEIELSLDGATFGEVRSLTPWLTTIEDACRHDRGGGRVACGPDTTIRGVRVSGRYVAVTLQGPETRLPCGEQAIGSGIVEDVALVVELEGKGEGWRIVGSRPRDRGCTVAAAAGTAFAADAHGYYWTGGDDVMAGPGAGKGRRVARLRDQARLLARDGGTFYWISAESGRVRRLAGGEAETVDEGGFDIGGLAVRDDAVYWTVYGRGEIRRYRAGHVSTVATNLEMPMGLAFHGDALLVATAAGIVAVDPSAGTRSPTTFEAVAPVGLAAHGGVVVWSEAGRRVLASTGGRTEVVASGAVPLQLDVRDGVIAWREPRTPSGAGPKIVRWKSGTKTADGP